MKRGYFLLILLICVLLIPAWACKSENRAIDLIPASASFIVGIELSEIVADQDFAGIYDGMEKGPDQPQTLDEALDELFQESGVDIKNFSRVLAFGDVSDMEQSEYIGFIAEGNFDETVLIGNIEEHSGENLATSDYKGHTLYTIEQEEFSLSFLSNKMLLGGTTRAVKDIIDVSNGDSEPVKGQLLDTYNRHRDALVSAAVLVPEDVWDTFSDETAIGDTGFSMDAFRHMDLLGYSLDKKQSTLSIQLEIHFLAADYVQDASDIISGLVGMLEGMADEPDLKNQLENIEVSVSGSWITISYEVETPQIDELMGLFGE
jgi:hypothetical protein